MNNQLVFSDYMIFVLYLVLVGSYGYWIYHRRKSKEHDSKGFFLAEGSLTWWAIGASLIASNISAEQFIGMSGNGFFVGVAVSAYEWIAALSLVIIAIWFIPIYLKNKIYTMPQFLKTRYNETVAMIMAILWLFIYIFVNLTSILYLGAVAISGLLPEGTNIDYLHIVMIALAVFSIFITLGGMKVIGFTDVIQVTVLILGGLATSYMALDKVSGGHGAVEGFATLLKQAPEHFHMIFKKPTVDSPQVEIDKYLLLPGILMYAAGQWIVNLNYWGCNQYITQRALGADLTTARTGLVVCSSSQVDYASDRNASGHCGLRIDETGSSSIHGTCKYGSCIFSRAGIFASRSERFIHSCADSSHSSLACRKNQQHFHYLYT